MLKIMSIDSLYKFFVEQNKSVNFNVKESGTPIVVSIPGNFEAKEDDMPGMLKLKLKVCHTKLNRNGSFISKENMEKAMPSIKYRPILAYIHKLEDGVEDFYAHNIEIVEDENGEEKIDYIEKQVGCFTADDPYLEYDEESDKDYVIAYAVIPEDYTSAADIIRRKNGTKVSCELCINELSYNAKEKYLDLTDFYFGGTTLLGCDEDGNEIGEGMLGARADITDFCQEKPVFTHQDKLVEVLDKLNVTLSNFTINHSTEEGGKDDMNKFEELLNKYGKTQEDIDFEFEGLTDEELEVKFEELFGKSDDSTKTSGTEGEDTDDTDTEGGTGDMGCKKKKKCSINENGNVSLEYEISHDDIRSAIYSLLAAESEDGYGWTWIIEVFDSKFIYQDYDANKYYRRSYTIDGDNVVLSDNKTEVFNEWLSQDEKDALDTLKQDYSNLKAFKDNYDVTEIKAKKDEIFARVEYSVLAEDESFKSLVAESEKYSIEECETRADVIFAQYCKSHGDFATNKEVKKSPKIIGTSFSKKEKSKKPYGNLFDK